ncbi:hypothetical protein LBMAG57_04480 [Verrucomicrobiota bacterium]|nr:hypothetical protein LBMAG57_04480 [Verrucomicrobiota bacterium]
MAVKKEQPEATPLKSELPSPWRTWSDPQGNKNEEARQLPSRVRAVFPERLARRPKYCADVLIASLEPLADAEIQLPPRGGRGIGEQRRRSGSKEHRGELAATGVGRHCAFFRSVHAAQ